MQQTVALADEDVRRVIRAVSADVQAALALSRAALQTIASLSPMLGAAAEDALDGELDLADRQAASPRVIEAIEDARSRLQVMPEQAELMSALERALLAAADALPELKDLDAVEAIVSGH